MAIDDDINFRAHMVCTTPRTAPEKCPVCGETSVKGAYKSVALALEAHILQAHPATEKPHPACVERQEKTINAQPPFWRLDWDVVRAGHAGNELYFCVPCGVYAQDVRKIH